MEIKTAYEVWQDVPYGDSENEAHRKKWVALDDVKEAIEDKIKFSKRYNEDNNDKYECEMRLNDLLKELKSEE